MSKVHAIAVCSFVIHLVGCGNTSEKTTTRRSPAVSQTDSKHDATDTSQSHSSAAIVASPSVRKSTAATTPAPSVPAPESCSETVAVYSSTIYLPLRSNPGLTTPVNSYSTTQDCTSKFAFKLFKMNDPKCASRFSAVYELSHPTIPNLGYLTANESEVSKLVNDGWTSKGVIGGVRSAAGESELYHVYDAASGSHLYTESAELVRFVLRPVNNPNGTRFYQQASLGLIDQKMLIGEQQTSTATMDGVCAGIKRWRDSAPSLEEANFWTSLIENKQADMGGFQRTLAISGSFEIAYNRGNTEAEWRFWDTQLHSNRVDLSQMRRILFVDAAFQSICGRANSANEFQQWNQFLIDHGDGKSALNKLKSMIQCN